MKNIVLIGILGSGKSTLGKALAKHLSMTFLDMDSVIEQEAQMKITQIFAEFGEENFRDRETALARRLSKAEGLVISTGGGVILREENMQALRENGVVIFLDRSPYAIIGRIKCDNRPLLRENPEKLFALHRERLPLYRKYADLTCKNRGTFGHTLTRLLRLIESEPQWFEPGAMPPRDQDKRGGKDKQSKPHSSHKRRRNNRRPTAT